MPLNPRLFPNNYVFESSEQGSESAAGLSLSSLQHQAWQGSIRQAYAARIGVQSAIRAGNLGIQILQKVLPTRLIGRFVETKEPSPGTHGYLTGGLEFIIEPGRRYHRVNSWIHKLVFAYDLLIPTNISTWPWSKWHRWTHADTSFGDSEVGFIKYFWIIHQVNFDTDTFSRIAARSHHRYCTIGLKGHNNGYSYGGNLRWADLFNWIDRFSYEGLLSVIIATRTTRPIHAGLSVENEQHGYIAGGLSDAPRLGASRPSTSIYRFTFFGELETHISATLSQGHFATYGQRGPGVSSVGYFPQGRDWRRFPESGFPLRHIFNEHTDRFNLETETRSVISAKVVQPKSHFGIVNSDFKGYLMGGITLSKPYAEYILAPNGAMWSTQNNDTDVFTIASETWTKLGANLSQAIRHPLGLDNQLR